MSRPHFSPSFGRRNQPSYTDTRRSQSKKPAEQIHWDRMRLFIAALFAATFCGQPEVQVLASFSYSSDSESEVLDSESHRVDSGTALLGTCNYNEFSCWSNGQCIPLYRQCDGNYDCSDGSDEDCTTTAMTTAATAAPTRAATHEPPAPVTTVRLVGGRNSSEGRVEVYYAGYWGTVCDDYWDLNDARVVCRSLGFGDAINAPHNAAFGEGSGPILLDDVQCSGFEASIFHCPHRGIGSHNCGHSKDASVICSPEEAYVVCDSTSMTLIMDKALLDVEDDGGDMHFVDDSCRGYTHDADHYAITTAYDRCSTTQKETDDYIVFSNVVTYNEPRPHDGTNGQLITREHFLRVPVECRIARRKTLSESFKPETGVVTFEEVGYGEFSLLFERYETEAFWQIADDSDLVFFGTPLYFGVNLTAASTNLTLWTENCWATPYADPMSGSNYTIIKEGCAEDDTVVFYNYYGPHFTGFKVDAFAFIGDYTEVFVHCSVLICDNSGPWSRCAQGCVSRSKRSDHPVGSRSTLHIISVGPLSLAQPNGDDTSKDVTGENANPLMIAAIGSLIGLVVLLLLILVMTLMRMRRGTRSNC